MNQHATVAELLPWFVNGTLNEADHALVDKHLKVCEECQSDLEQVLEMSAMFNAEKSDEIGTQNAARKKFEAALAHTKKDSLFEPYGSSATKVMASVAGVFFIAAVSMLFVPDETTFTTMSRSEPNHATVLQIVFRDGVTEDSIGDILMTEGRILLSGPSRLGVYRVSIGSGPGDELVRKLAEDPRVEFVEVEE